MKEKIKIFITLALAAFPLMTAGQNYELSKNGTTIIIKGTSSLHNWEMDVRAFTSEIKVDHEGSTADIYNVSFVCRATDLKSESSLMDKKAYDALKAKNFPEIKFESTSKAGIVIKDNKFSGNLNGRLIIAGKTEQVTIPFSGFIDGNNVISISAETDLLMSSFNIAPPTAMLGALKTGDKISVLLSLQYVSTAQLSLQ
jgi:polyisoprenoid-binding protein YceI